MISALGLWAAACGDAVSVGAACVGDCASTLLDTAETEPCSFSEQYVPASPAGPDVTVCPRTELERDAEGLVNCRIQWRSPDSCLERRSFTPPGDSTPLPDRRCLVRQVRKPAATQSAEGWFYAGNPATTCVFYEDDLELEPEPAEFRMPLDALVSETAEEIEVVCENVEAVNRTGRPVPVEAVAQCAMPEPSNRDERAVGVICKPRADDELDARSNALETAAPACGGAVCLTPRCPDGKRDACPTERSYCSCRCAAPGSDASEGSCACPDGFHCGPFLEWGPHMLIGQYCMRD